MSGDPTLAMSIPAVPSSLLERYDAQHLRARTAISSLKPRAQRLTKAWLRARMTESLAGLRASWFGRSDPPIIPTPRGFLGAESRERLAGIQRALDHVQTRIQGTSDRRSENLIGWETPFVLHALATSATASPGARVAIFRSSPSGWADDHHAYRPPPPSDVPAIVAATLHRLAGAADEHPAVLAAWFACAFMTIHPFEDGNGRTARLLHLLISSAALDGELDHGIAEMWMVHRTGYHERLRAVEGRSPNYDPQILDARPFVEATLDWSAAGAALTAARADVVAYLDASLPGSDEVREAAAAALLENGTTPERLLAGPYGEQVDALERAVTAGLVLRSPRPPSRRNQAGARAKPWYVPTGGALRIFHDVLTGSRHEGDRPL